MSRTRHNVKINPEAGPQALEPYRERMLLAIILLGALGIRLWHLTWGLPNVYEAAYPFHAAWKYWNWGEAGLQFNPQVFYYPALSAHIQFMVQVLHYGIGRLLGAYSDLEAYRLAYVADPTIFLAQARLITALLDVATVWLVFEIGKRLISGGGGLVAAALVGVNPLHVQQAQMITVDTPMTFFVMLALFTIIRVHTTGTTGWYILGGISIGLAAATRYTAALLLIPLCAASLLRASTVKVAVRSLRTGELLGGIILSVIVFLQMNPYVVLNRAKFLYDLNVARVSILSGPPGSGPSGRPLAEYSLKLVPDVIGWPLLIIVVVATAILLWRRRRGDIVLLAFPIVYAAMLVVRMPRADYYLLPLISSLVLVGVRGLQAIAFPKGIRGRRGIAGVAVLVVGAAVFAPPIAGLVARETARALPDTRDVARQWIVSNIPFSASIAVGAPNLSLPRDRYLLLSIPDNPAGPELIAPFYSTAWYTDLDCVVGSSLDPAVYAQNPPRYKPLLAFYDSLKTRWRLAFSIKPAQRQSGPELWVFQPPQHPKSGPFDSSMIRSLSTVGNTVTSINFAGKLAMILSMRGLLDRSTQLLQYIVQADPRNRSGYRELASVFYQQGKIKEALQAVDTALRLEPNDAEMLTAKGNMLMDLQRTAEAEPLFRRALELDRSQEAAYIGLARLYELRGDKKKALEILKQYRGILRSGDDKVRALDERMHNLGG